MGFAEDYREAWRNVLYRQRLVNRYLEIINSKFDDLRDEYESGRITREEKEERRLNIERQRNEIDSFCENIRKEVEFLESLVRKDAEEHRKNR